MSTARSVVSELTRSPNDNFKRSRRQKFQSLFSWGSMHAAETWWCVRFFRSSVGYIDGCAAPGTNVVQKSASCSDLCGLDNINTRYIKPA